MKKTFYDILEDAVVERLDPLKSVGYELERLPETDAENRPPYSKPRITVVVTGAEYSDQIVRGIPNNFSMGIVSQDEYPVVAVVLRSKKLRGNFGIYAMKAQATKYLLGFNPSSYGKLFLKSFNYVSRENNVFEYALEFICKTRILQAEENEIDNITNTSNTGLTEANKNTKLNQVIIDPITATDKNGN